MNPVKRNAVVLLIGALALAELTPLYISYAVPWSAGYHRNAVVVVLQAIPYLVCAAIWLPRQGSGAAKVAYRLSLALFGVACLIYVPSWVNPHGGGDMVGLAYIIICLVTTGAIVAISGVVAAARWWSRRNTVPNA